MPLVALVVLALVVGVLIGTVGVGGVALPPFLTWFAGFDPHTAAGTSSWAFVFTGTGSPVFLVPTLLLLGVPALTAVAVAQVVQLPLVAAAVLGYARQGTIDFGTGSLIGVLAGLGVVAGAKIAMRVPRRVLSLITGFALAGFGVLLTGTTALTLLG